MRDRAAAQELNHEVTDLTALRAQLRAATLRPEADASGEMLADLSEAQAALERAGTRAARWVEAARADKRSRPLVDKMLEQFPLDSAQGRALMSLAEALLRTPDPQRADQLIAERLAEVRGGDGRPGAGTERGGEVRADGRGGEPGGGAASGSATGGGARPD